MSNLSKLVGKTIKEIEGLHKGSVEVRILLTDGSSVDFWHKQDCCESVDLYDFELTVKDVSKLVGAVINDAREDDSGLDCDYEPEDSFTWTFYNINTSKGCINMRWLGVSNGYYSERITVSFSESV